MYADVMNDIWVSDAVVRVWTAVRTWTSWTGPKVRVKVQRICWTEPKVRFKVQAKARQLNLTQTFQPYNEKSAKNWAELDKFQAQKGVTVFDGRLNEHSSDCSLFWKVALEHRSDLTPSLRLSHHDTMLFTIVNIPWE